MSIQNFPLTSIQKVRKYIRGSLLLTASAKSASAVALTDDIPEPESIDELSGIFTFGAPSPPDTSVSNSVEKWVVSTVNPAAPLLKLPGLKLKPGFRLVSYLYHTAEGGVGVVWAVPEALGTMVQLEASLKGSNSMASVPKPAGALGHFMEAIEGDRSPVSFMIASLLRRELQEFGSLGDRHNWNQHDLIADVPPNLSWQWRADPPKNFLPKVRISPDGQAAVEFFTCRHTVPTTLYRHVDRYPVHQYRGDSLDKSVAVARSE